MCHSMGLFVPFTVIQDNTVILWVPTGHELCNTKHCRQFSVHINALANLHIPIDPAPVSHTSGLHSQGKEFCVQLAVLLYIHDRGFPPIYSSLFYMITDIGTPISAWDPKILNRENSLYEKNTVNRSCCARPWTCGLWIIGFNINGQKLGVTCGRAEESNLWVVIVLSAGIWKIACSWWNMTSVSIFMDAVMFYWCGMSVKNYWLLIFIVIGALRRELFSNVCQKIRYLLPLSSISHTCLS